MIADPRRLRSFTGVKPVAAPSGVAIRTRLRLSPADEHVIGEVAAWTSMLRRRDLAVRSTLGDRPDKATLSARKRALTAESSARWASAIIRANDDQYRLARMAQARHIQSLTAAVEMITARAAIKCGTKDGRVKGYPTQAERFEKLRRLQHLKAKLAAERDDVAAGRVKVVDGGQRLARNRHHLDTAGITVDEWRHKWDCERQTIRTIGSGDEPFGNLTLTVDPTGTVSVRLPKPLEHIANQTHGRYRLDATATFAYRTGEWQQRIADGAVSYRLHRRPDRDGWYLTANWSTPDREAPERSGRTVGVDLNADHLAAWIVDEHGNPTGAPRSIPFDLTGPASRRDAQIRHAISRLLHWACRMGADTIAVEDLNFDDARTVGRETMGRGRHGKQFRRTVAGIRNRLAGMTHRAVINLIAVNPAYTSMWGDQHWRKPTSTTRRATTRHQAAAIVIARRSQRHRARRREGVTVVRPEDRTRRATNQTEQRPKGSGPATEPEHTRNGVRSIDTYRWNHQPSNRYLGSGHNDRQLK